MRFVETPIFTKVITALLDDESYRGLQSALIRRPEQGPTIGGTHGARKVRWARPGAGKRGGIRVIYYWARNRDQLLMLLMYPKSERDDLTRSQLKLLRKLVEEEYQ